MKELGIISYPYFVIITTPLPLPWDGKLNFLLEHGLELPNETNIGKAFLHNHGYSFCSSLSPFINGIF